MNQSRAPEGAFAGLGGEPTAWMSAYLQPWSMLQDWNAFWNRQWKAWFDTLVAAPAPWLAPLAAGRSDSRAAVDFFLPWLPRIEAVVTPLGEPGGQDAVRVMLRAALPHIGPGDKTEWLNVDATVSRGAAESSPALSAEPPLALPAAEGTPALAEEAPKLAAPSRRARKSPASPKARGGKAAPSGE